MRLTFAQIAPFVADWRRLKLTDDDLRALERQIMEDPDAAPVIAGTGGLRKTRFAPPSLHRGKSGGTRVCYAHFPIRRVAWLIAIYPKNEKKNLSPTEKNDIKALLKRLDAATSKGA